MSIVPLYAGGLTSMHTQGYLPQVCVGSKPFTNTFSPSVQIDEIKIAEFNAAISSVFQQTQPLMHVLHLMTTEKNETVKAALVKQEGYFSRLFSDESWDDWLEPKTSLGKIVHLFTRFVEDAPINYQELNAKAVQEAVEESEGILTQCSVGLVMGGVGSLVTHNPVPLSIASLNCLNTVSAVETLHQGHIIVQPGGKFYIEVTANGKIAVCKRGKTYWDSESSCGYHGPEMRVTVIRDNDILYSGHFGGSHTWYMTSGSRRLSIEIVNDSDRESAMYVHAQNDHSSGCVIM